MKFYHIFLFITFALKPSIIHSIEYIDLLKICPIEYDIINNYEPEEFLKTNNLFKPTIPNNVRKIILYGNIKNSESKPMKDTKILLWQTDDAGFYNYKGLKQRTEKELFKFSEYFLGNGTASTDNLGNFYFITLYPKNIHRIKSHINLRIEEAFSGQTSQVRIVLPNCKTINTRFYNQYINENIIDFMFKNKIELYKFEINLT
ncbi:MAG: hypothetical protein ISN64_00035 [Rickettsia sp.]|nr:hypothetical protein [Rickettsia sp.]